MSKSPTSTVQAKIGSTSVLEIGTPVVFTTDIAFKSSTGRVSYVAKVGITGKVKSVDPRSKKMKIEVDKKLSTRRSEINDVEPEWVAALAGPIVLDTPPKAEDTGPSWKGFDYEELKQIATKNNLSWRETKNTRINKMWVIDALKKANVQPPVAGVNPDNNKAV
ncbi:hypothetical protein D3C74_50440 [compost metagenome]